MIIELKNDPLPARKRWYGGRRPTSPIREALELMQVGHCFYVPYTKQKLNLISSTATIIKAKTGKRFATRKIEGENETKLGVWRIA